MDACINLPIILTENEAENVGNMILENIKVENGVIKFTLPFVLSDSKPGSFIDLRCKNKSYKIRVVNIQLKNIGCKITGIIDQRQVYFNTSISNDIVAGKTNVLLSQADDELLINRTSGDTGLKKINRINLNNYYCCLQPFRPTSISTPIADLVIKSLPSAASPAIFAYNLPPKATILDKIPLPT